MVSGYDKIKEFNLKSRIKKKSENSKSETKSMSTMNSSGLDISHFNFLLKNSMEKIIENVFNQLNSLSMKKIKWDT